MTDLEITKLCAEAMDLCDRMGPDWNQGPGGVMLDGFGGKRMIYYDPLHDDEQAMALVKRFNLNIGYRRLNVDATWVVHFEWDCSAESNDLNRAICECVAKMQASK